MKLTTPQSRPFNRLDELKGIAMLMVIFTHNSWSDDDALALAFPFWIDMAVPIFMIISGYLNALSAKKQNQLTLAAGYEPVSLLKKFIRFYMPFWFVCILIFAIDFLRGTGYGPDDYLAVLFLGEAKFGGYYPLMMLQLVLLFPLIYQVMRRHRRIGLLLALIINVIYESLKGVIGVDSTLYRVLILRFLLAIAMGAFIALYDRDIPKWLLAVAFLAGFAVTYLNSYQDMEIGGITRWISRGWPCVFYIMPLIYLAIKDNAMKPCRAKFVGLIGAKSYHVFLAQMLYYCSLRKFVYRIINAYVTEYWLILAVKTVVNLTICLTLGLLFAHFAEPVEKAVISKLPSGKERENSNGNNK